jgi:hypothetical protein
MYAKSNFQFLIQTPLWLLRSNLIRILETVSSINSITLKPVRTKHIIYCNSLRYAIHSQIMRKFKNILEFLKRNQALLWRMCLPGYDYVCCDTNLPNDVSEYHTPPYSGCNLEAAQSLEAAMNCTRLHGVTSQKLTYSPLWYPQTWHTVLFDVAVLWGPQMRTETEKPTFGQQASHPLTSLNEDAIWDRRRYGIEQWRNYE